MFWTVTLSLLQGLRQAAVLFGLTLAFSLPLGLLVALGSMSRCRPVRAVFDALVWVIRGTPLVLQLIIIFYGPGLWLGRNIWGSHRMLACIVAFVLNYACYFSVIYRGGIQAIPAVFALIGQIQEETHRFAITYHHESHQKSALRSELEDVPGVGPKRREALRKHFGSMRAIREADVETLSAVVPRAAAEAVYRHFHQEQGEPD